MKKHIRILAALLGSVWFLCLATPAHAIALFEFDITFDTGTLMGNTYTGTITTDSFADGIYTPPDPAFFDGRLLTYDIIVDSIAFDETDEVGYDFYPLAAIASGDLNRIEYTGISGDYRLDTTLGAIGNVVNFLDVSSVPVLLAEGYVSDTRCVEGCTVPEPGTLVLLGVGLAGVGFTRRRMKA